jgi:hypothetical protein
MRRLRGSVGKRVVPVLVVLLGPSLLAAADPAGDPVPCPSLPEGSTSAVASVPDLVRADGEIVELGTSIRFTLRFAEPLAVPDGEGRPFRVDVVLFDPEVPPVEAGLYRDVNRILRYDAVREPMTTTLLLPEAGQSRFLPPTIEGDTMVLQVPGRTVVADEDETGTSPGLDQLRWGVIVRDEGACDLLGDGRPGEELVRAAAPEPARVAEAPSVRSGSSTSPPWWAIAAGAAIASIVVLGYVVLRRRSVR